MPQLEFCIASLDSPASSPAGHDTMHSSVKHRASLTTCKAQGKFSLWQHQTRAAMMAFVLWVCLFLHCMFHVKNNVINITTPPAGDSIPGTFIHGLEAHDTSGVLHQKLQSVAKLCKTSALWHCDHFVSLANIVQGGGGGGCLSGVGNSQSLEKTITCANCFAIDCSSGKLTTYESFKSCVILFCFLLLYFEIIDLPTEFTCGEKELGITLGTL